MKRKRVRRMVRVIGIILCGFLLSGLNNMVYAESAKDILNQINKEIRKAERDMFSGKIDKAIASLDPIRELFGKVKKADPNNPKIKTMEKGW